MTSLPGDATVKRGNTGPAAGPPATTVPADDSPRPRQALTLLLALAAAHLLVRSLPAPATLLVSSVELVALATFAVLRPSSSYRPLLSAWMVALIIPIANAMGHDGYEGLLARLVSAVAITTAAVFALRGPWGLGRATFALHPDRTLALHLGAMAAALVLAFAGIALGMRPTGAAVVGTGGIPPLVWLAAAVGGGAQEILVRGAVLFAALGLARSAPIAIAGTALLAGVAAAAPGAPLGAIVFAVILGLVTGAVAVRTSSVTGAVAAQALSAGTLAIF